MTDSNADNGAQDRGGRASVPVLAFKILVAAAMLGLVLWRVDLNELLAQLTQLSLLWFAAALLALNVGQWFSALRMRFYLTTVGKTLPRGLSVALYYVSALFNVLLPGGVSGDLYRVWLLGRRLEIAKLAVTRLILLERASGLLVLGILTLLALALAPAPVFGIAPVLWLIAIPILFLAYLAATRWILRDPTRNSLRALPYSIAGQGLILACGWIIFLGMGVEQALPYYLAVFLFSNLVAVIPLSFGGIGVREATFFLLAPFLPIDAEVGVAAMLIFYAVHLLTSLIGGLFLHRAQGDWHLREVVEEVGG